MFAQALLRLSQDTNNVVDYWIFYYMIKNMKCIDWLINHILVCQKMATLTHFYPYLKYSFCLIFLVASILLREGITYMNKWITICFNGIFVKFVIILLNTYFFLQIGECRFQSTNSRWSINLDGETNVECNNEEFCLAAANLDRSDCEYRIKPLREDGFGAEVFGLSLG